MSKQNKIYINCGDNYNTLTSELSYKDENITFKYLN